MMHYKNSIHKRIFEDQVRRNPCKCPNEYLAALYLLSADKTLWKSAKYVIGKKKIDFTRVRPNEFNEYNYTVFTVAQDLYTGSTHITIKDICSRYLISDNQFDLFITAINICRLGYAYTDIQKKFN